MDNTNCWMAMALVGLCALSVPCDTVLAQTPPLESAARSFRITLHADADRALRAFGPIEETRWAPEWQPEMFSSTGDRNDPDAAVFRIGHGSSESLWTLSRHDRQRRELQYVVVNAGKMVTVIDIRCSPIDARTTSAEVAYRKVALAAEHNADVRHFAEHFTDQRQHWEKAINAYLDKRP